VAGPGSAAPEPCRDKVMITSPATAIAARRRISLAGLAGSCSWNSQVPAIRKYTLPVTVEIGTRMEARQDCRPTW
jgi:hypothetical protein